MAEPDRFDVAIVGAGFAGSILARALARLGHAVILLEKARHPRFALGESSTPLANLCLERLAVRYDLPDLYELATYGRWLESHPELRRGLKRGFTFYRHRPEEVFSPGSGNADRLLVAASPEDDLADSHWLRADVDQFLAQRAVEEGVRLLEDSEVEAVERDRGGFEIAVVERAPIRARYVVDATGPRGVVGQALGAGRRPPERVARFGSALVFGHFSGLRPFDTRGAFEPGPYRDEQAAVHHLLEEGWMYVLPFDHGIASAGLILDREHPSSEISRREPGEIWQRVLGRYPSLERQFGRARPEEPLGAVGRMQYRRQRAAAAAGDCEGAGRGAWALLPHAFAFFDPMFSTGIAWSLLGVERLARAFESLEQDPSGEELARRLHGYGRLLDLEADQIERLVFGGYLARRDMKLFAAQSFLYFAAVSFEELRQRLLDPAGEEVVSRGFLGAGRPGWESLFEEAVARLRGVGRSAEPVRTRLAEGFHAWVTSSIAAHNLIGLGDPERRNLYPVDLDLLVDRAGLLGLKPAEMKRRLPRLRGGAERFGGPPTRIK